MIPSTRTFAHASGSLRIIVAAAITSAALGLSAPAAAFHSAVVAYPLDPALGSLTVSAGTGSDVISATGRISIEVVINGSTLEIQPHDPSASVHGSSRIDLADFDILVAADPVAGDTRLRSVLVSMEIPTGVVPDLDPGTNDFLWDLSSVVVRLSRGHLILSGPGGTFMRDLQFDPLELTMGSVQIATDWDTLFGSDPTFAVGRQLAVPIDATGVAAPFGLSLSIQGLLDSGVVPTNNFVVAPACANGADDDGDLLVDHPADPGCESLLDDRENPRCDDGFDNNFDGMADYPLEPSCLTPLQDFETWACEDGVDNDGDGLIDAGQDPGCLSPTDATEFSGCDDGIDNDGDTVTDFPQDSGCQSVADDDETDPAQPCDDGFDNDGDTRIDFPDDEGCLAPSWHREDPQCSDGINNDGDALIDFDGGAGQNGGTPISGIDPQCFTRPWKDKEAKGGRCGLGFELGALALLGLRRRRRRG